MPMAMAPVWTGSSPAGVSFEAICTPVSTNRNTAAGQTLRPAFARVQAHQAPAAASRPISRVDSGTGQFHQPRPTFSPPNHSSRSGRWTRKSSAQWENTASPTNADARHGVFSSQRASTAPPTDQASAPGRLWVKGMW